MSKTFIVIQQHLWCNEKGHGIEYTTDSIESDDRDNAIKRGLKMQGSDDFNIGVIDGGRLVSFDWMDKPVGESAETLAEIAEAIGYEGGCPMSNIDKPALREEFKMMQECYSDPADRERQLIYIAAEAMLDELETAESRIAELEAREINLPPNELVTDTWTSPGDGWEVFDAQKVVDSIRTAGVKIAAGITVKGE